MAPAAHMSNRTRAPSNGATRLLVCASIKIKTQNKITFNYFFFELIIGSWVALLPHGASLRTPGLSLGSLFAALAMQRGRPHNSRTSATSAFVWTQPL